MNIITVDCPDCLQPNYTATTRCWKCNKLLDVSKLIREQISKQFSCPNCLSDNTSSFEMIYQSGTATGKFSSYSFNPDFGGTSTMGKTKSQSLLAQQVAPPKMQNNGCAKAVAGIFLFGFSLVILLTLTVCGFIIGGYVFGELNGGWLLATGGVGFLIGVFVAFTSLRYFTKKLDKEYDSNQTKIDWQKNYEIWQNSWLCIKCGHRWVQKQ